MTHFYSAESVTAGHPDKLCDQIADTVLDGCLALDRNARVACEVLATQGHVILAGEISTAVMPDLGKLTREALENAGYNPKDFEIESLIHPQSPDIEAAVNDPLDAESDPNAIGAGDQCVVVGYNRVYSSIAVYWYSHLSSFCQGSERDYRYHKCYVISQICGLEAEKAMNVSKTGQPTH